MIRSSIVYLRSGRSIMMSFVDPNTVRPSRDGVVPRASYVLDPRPLRDSPNDDLRLQLYKICHRGRRFIIFLSILLGDDQAVDVGATDNKRGAWNGTDHDTMQLHGGQLANPTTTLWLPENLKNRGATLGYKTGEDFIKHMKMVLYEVLKFGARATDVTKAFARMEFHLVKPSLLHLEDLRSTLQGIVKDMETKLPLIDPLWPDIEPLLADIEPSDKFVPGASHILEPQPPRVGSIADNLPLQLRDRFYQLEQFHIFLSILLGEDQPPDEAATIHDSGGALSGTDHDSLQSHGGELVAPTTTVWLPEYLKKRDAIPNYNAERCWDQLKGPFKEVMKFGARATDVAKAFARMEIDHVEYLLMSPEDLRSTLQQFDTIAEDKDTRELIKIFMPDLDFDVSLDALPDKLLPDIEPIDDDYIKLSVFNYFGKSEGEWPEI